VNSIDFAGIGMTSQRTRERLIKRLEEQGISDQAVLDVIKRTPRHLFLDEALAHRAYEDTALPIGFSQTLSQPYIVARMTEILAKCRAHASRTRDWNWFWLPNNHIGSAR
jgi:protein-L-isoaspartate(D-aspartate) O-methyltransferase